MPLQSNERVWENDYCVVLGDGSMSVKDLRRHWSGKIWMILGIIGTAVSITEVIALAQWSHNQSGHEIGVMLWAIWTLAGVALIVYGKAKDTKKQAGFGEHLLSLAQEEEAKLGKKLTVEEKLQVGTRVFDM